MTTFEAGDLVIKTNNGKPQAIRVVERVTKRFLELSDGSRWQLDGSNSYPRTRDIWYHKRIEAWSKEKADTIHRENLLYAIRNNQWDSLETDQLEAVAKAAGLRIPGRMP